MSDDFAAFMKERYDEAEALARAAFDGAAHKEGAAVKRVARLLRAVADRIDREGAPAGVLWFRHPRIGDRWRFDGRTYVLVSISVSRSVTLDYAELGSWEASYLIDPHANCRPKRRPRLGQKTQ